MKSIHIDIKLALSDFNLSLNLDLPVTGVSAVLGASGSGKTTLLRCIAGLEVPEHGRLSVNGNVWFDSQLGINVPTYERRIAYVFQEPSLFPHLSVKKNIEYGLKRTAVKQRQFDQSMVTEILEITHLLMRSPNRLSGGERQRVAIARAILISPNLLLMDEPLASLDSGSKQAILPYIARLRDEMKIPIIYVTHSLDEVIELSDYLVLLEKGRVSAQGLPSELLVQQSLPLAGKGDAAAIVDTTIESHDITFQLTYLRFSGGVIAIEHRDLPIGSKVRVVIKARDVSLTLARPEKTSILNCFKARILGVDPDTEAQNIVRLKVGQTILLAKVTLKSIRLLELKAGLVVYVQVKSAAIMK